MTQFLNLQDAQLQGWQPTPSLQAFYTSSVGQFLKALVKKLLDSSHLILGHALDWSLTSHSAYPAKPSPLSKLWTPMFFIFWEDHTLCSKSLSFLYPRFQPANYLDIRTCKHWQPTHSHICSTLWAPPDQWGWTFHQVCQRTTRSSLMWFHEKG